MTNTKITNTNIDIQKHISASKTQTPYCGKSMNKSRSVYFAPMYPHQRVIKNNALSDANLVLKNILWIGILMLAILVPLLACAHKYYEWKEDKREYERMVAILIKDK